MKKVLGYAMLALLATPLCLQGQIRLGISGGAGNFTGDDFEGSKTGWTVGGELVTPPKKLNGARFGRPEWSHVLSHAIGRGIRHAIRSRYASRPARSCAWISM